MNADRKMCGLDPSSDYVDLAAEVLGILSDPTRLRIVLALHRHEEMAVGDLAATVGKSPSGVSQHLARLRLARMVSSRQDGNRVLYRLKDEHVLAVAVEAVKQAEHSIAETGQLPPHHHRPTTA